MAVPKGLADQPFAGPDRPRRQLVLRESARGAGKERAPLTVELEDGHAVRGEEPMGPVDHEPEELGELDAAGWNREDLAEFGADGRVDFRGWTRLGRLPHARLHRVVILPRRGGHARRAD